MYLVWLCLRVRVRYMRYVFIVYKYMATNYIYNYISTVLSVWLCGSTQRFMFYDNAEAIMSKYVNVCGKGRWQK